MALLLSGTGASSGYATINPKAIPGSSVGAISILMVIKRTGTNTGYALALTNAAGTGQAYVGINVTGGTGSSDAPFFSTSALSSPVSSMQVTAADGWICLGITKAAGSAIPRFHKYVYSTGVSTHNNGDVVTGDFTPDPTGLAIFARYAVAPADGFNMAGGYHACAIYPRVLGDQEFESAASSLSAMMALDPSYGMFVFDAGVASVIDLVGGGAQITNTGTTDGGGTPVGYGHMAMFETPPASAPQTLSPTALATTEAFGTAVVGGTITLSPTAIATAEAFGTAAVSMTVTLSPTAIATAEAFGTAVLGGSVTLSPTAIDSTEAFGTAAVSTVGTLSPVAIASLEAFGTVVISGAVTLSPTSIPTAGAFGAVVTTGQAAIGLAGIETAEVFGSPTISTIVRRFTTPAVRKQFAKEGLWRWYGYDEGQALLLLDSAWQLLARPTAVQLETAETVYMGGREYILSATDAAILAGEGYTVVTEESAVPEPTGTAYEAEVLADSPEMYYKLDETSGAVATDSSGHGRDAVLTLNPSAALVLESIGAQELIGDGSTALLALVDVPLTLTEFSFEAWMDGAGFAVPFAFFNSVNSDTAVIYAGYPAPGSVSLIARTFEDQFTQLTATAAGTGWETGVHHFVATGDGTTLRLYIDGAEVATQAYTGTFQPDGYFVTQADTSTSAFDEVAFYSTALSADRVLAHYNAGS